MIFSTLGTTHVGNVHAVTILWEPLVMNGDAMGSCLREYFVKHSIKTEHVGQHHFEILMILPKSYTHINQDLTIRIVIIAVPLTLSSSLISSSGSVRRLVSIALQCCLPVQSWSF